MAADTHIPTSPQPIAPPRGTGGVAVRDLLPNLKLIARDRLHLSSPRVERLLDDAAEESRPLEAVIADIRRMTIRGVLPSTLEEVADGMVTLARSRTSTSGWPT
ncbi:MAG: hypothetical protein ABR532_00095 [Candidatus Dormibacteria bacterium]